MMKVILREDVPNLGVVGDMVTVRDGYGRNYLIPQGKAIFASVKSIAQLDHQKRLAAHHRKQATKDAEVGKQKIEGLSVVMQAKVAPPQLDDEGEPIIETLQKLFGTITTRDIAKVVSDSGTKVDHRRVTITTPVRTVGKFSALVRLDGGIIATLPFWVVPEGTSDLEAGKKNVEQAQIDAKREAEEAQAAEAAKLAAARAAADAEAEAANAAEEEGDAEASDDAEADA
ncbi:MAG: 50S ribosomal protein L9 [Deltaproteobacteria bacterium]|jgi:large subunit ribosomal protein L9